MWALIVGGVEVGSGHVVQAYMGGCQNHDPFLGTLDIRCSIRTGIQKGTTILTTTHIRSYENSLGPFLTIQTLEPL